MKYLPLTLLCLLFFGQANAQSLWRDIPVGATVEQARKKLPGATSPSEPSVLADGKTIGLLEYAGFQLADLDFKATLYFNSGKLERIFLNPVTRPTGQTARTAAHKLRDSLQAKYGSPNGTENPRSSLGTSQSAEWSVRGTLIKFSFTQYSDEGVGFLQVLYVAPQDTSNL